MSGPIIPVEHWPEWADRHCWNSDGSGVFCGATISSGGVWIRTLAESSIPMPKGHDWRVPVMRASAEAIDLAQFRESVEAEHELAMCEWRGDQISDEQASVAHVKRDRLLALIDAHKEG